MDERTMIREIWRSVIRIENPQEERIIELYVGPFMFMDNYIMTLKSPKYLFSYIYEGSLWKLTRKFHLENKQSMIEVKHYNKPLKIYEWDGIMPLNIFGYIKLTMNNKKVEGKVTLYIVEHCLKYGAGYGELVLGKDNKLF